MEKGEAEVFSSGLEGGQLVLVQDFGDEARCCSSEVSSYEAGCTSLNSFELVDVLL